MKEFILWVSLQFGYEGAPDMMETMEIPKRQENKHIQHLGQVPTVGGDGDSWPKKKKTDISLKFFR